MNYKFLPLVVAFFSLFAVEARAQASIDWQAQGLPPGLSIAPVVSPTNGLARISGTPTTPGTYYSTVYPVVEGVAGDMREMRFDILPPGVNLPTYYSYQRRAPIKGGNFTAICGGGNGIFGTVGAKRLAFTANGTDFSLLNLPTGFTDVYQLAAAATAGTRTMALFRSYNNMGVSSMGCFLSINGGPFTTVALPPEVTDGSSYNSSLTLTSIPAGFYLVKADINSNMAYPNYSQSTSATITIWVRGATGSSWGTPRIVSVPLSEPIMYYSSSPIFASVASAGTTRMMVVEMMYMNTVATRALLRSSNSGSSWSVVSGAPALSSITYDTVNRRFVGSAADGVWTSANGATGWTKRSSSETGRLAYSPTAQLLFSAREGVSSDGVNWLPYFSPDLSSGEQHTAWDNARVITTDSGLVFRADYQSHQLSPVFVPSFWSEPLQKGQQGTPFSYDFSVDQ
jgi:hypothetical protein